MQKVHLPNDGEEARSANCRSEAAVGGVTGITVMSSKRPPIFIDIHCRWCKQRMPALTQDHRAPASPHTPPLSTVNASFFNSTWPHCVAWFVSFSVHTIICVSEREEDAYEFIFYASHSSLSSVTMYPFSKPWCCLVSPCRLRFYCLTSPSLNAVSTCGC